MADLNGLDLRRRLASADRFSDSATCFALRFLKTPLSRSSASLRCMTCADHLPVDFPFVRDALRAAADRSLRACRLAADRACRASAACEAALRSSRLSAAAVARD